MNLRSDLPPSWDPFVQPEDDDGNSKLLQGEHSAAQQSNGNQNPHMQNFLSGNTTTAAQVHILSDD